MCTACKIQAVFVSVNFLLQRGQACVIDVFDKNLCIKTKINKTTNRPLPKVADVVIKPDLYYKYGLLSP
jgi:hypothetical protein